MGVYLRNARLVNIVKLTDMINHYNRIVKKMHMIISRDTEDISQKSQHQFV